MDAVRQLLEIMSRLRDPEHGCPWDLRQTYSTIVPYTLEEAYEVADAIQRDDMHELRDELGDLLFQVVFYSQIAMEEGHFDFNQVAQSICEKMLRRHPHVFSDAEYRSDEELRQAWEHAKAQERELRCSTERTSLLDGIARALPALIRAEKLQKRAADVGFDWPDEKGVLEKVHEELDEVQTELGHGNTSRLQDELGDLLFSIVNLVRQLGLNAEQTMSRANEKFERRFRAMEAAFEQRGRHKLDRLSPEEWDQAWEVVKSEERARS